LSTAPAKPRHVAPDSAFVDRIAPSPNVGVRRGGGAIDFLILHYTGLETARRSLEVLCDPRCEVSCHYLIDDDGAITQMVNEADRAWHAGLSSWHGVEDINSHSIGIEIQNPGHAHGYPVFPEAQMAAVEALAGDIVERRRIRPENVLAHSDIAPQRKIDPGEKFDWARLAEAGIGHWVAPRGLSPQEALDDLAPWQADPRVAHCQALLSMYGYRVARDGVLDAATMKVITAFQRHFRPALVNGLPDASTIGTLEDLLDALGG
jgi:N-acetylmuramoyl-L-alanine amidase